jgi:chromosome transmission fidelity protein 1
LSSNHALHLKRLIVFLEAFKKYLAEWLEAKQSKKCLDGEVEVMTVVELMQRLGRKAEGINMLEIEAYLRSSKVVVISFSTENPKSDLEVVQIARKISGYSDKLAERAAGQGEFKCRG